MVYTGNTLETISAMEFNNSSNDFLFNVGSTDITFIWNKGNSMKITVNKVAYELLQNEIIILNSFHKIENINVDTVRLLQFNLPFLCLYNNDTSIGIKGMLFFGATDVPIVSIKENELDTFDNSWDIFCSEMQSRDSLKSEMLHSILKRIIILCTRNLKHTCHQVHRKYEPNILREFNLLVEGHFSEHHDVAFYASKLNKSPKTLSNLFSVLSDRTPIDIIHDRIMMHARRQIYSTSMSIKEIAYDLGYEDIQTFSRFFKNKEGLSPIQYREKVKHNSERDSLAIN
ncbi:MAG: AraC family transcriptional regulator [Flavobacterium sp.]|nr:AraC family transcriptional regulator [Flavobacterium sp.]